jgi:hypothetical protein
MGRVHHLRRGWTTKPSRFTEEQIIGILREQEVGQRRPMSDRVVAAIDEVAAEAVLAAR